MKKFFKYIKSNWRDVVIGIILLVEIIALVVPFVIAISRAMWAWALL